MYQIYESNQTFFILCLHDLYLYFYKFAAYNDSRARFDSVAYLLGK